MLSLGVRSPWFSSLSILLQVLLEITKFHLHKSVPGAGVIRIAREGLIWGNEVFTQLYHLVLQIRKIEAALEYAIFELTPPNAQSSVALLPLYELYMQ